MKREFTATIEAAPEGGFWAMSPEIQEANGQGETVDGAKKSLTEAIKLVLEDKLEDFTRGLSEDIIMDIVAVE